MVYEAPGIVAFTKLAPTLLPTAMSALSSLLHVDLNHIFDAAPDSLHPGVVELAATGGTGHTPADPIKPDHFGDRPVSDTMEHAFDGNDTDTDTSNDSPFMKATRAVALEYAHNQHMTPEQSEAFVKAFMHDVYSHKQDFIDAYNDHSGHFSRGDIKDTYLKDGKFIMGNGAFTAQYTELQLMQREQAVQYTYTYTDAAGHKQLVHLNIADRCLNPLMDQHPEPVQTAPVTPEPVVETPKPTVTYAVDPYAVCRGGDVEKALIAIIHVPNADPSSPEYQAAVQAAIPDIHRTHDVAGDGFDKNTRVVIVGPDGKILDAECLKPGKSELSDDWYIYDAKGHEIKRIDPKEVPIVLLGADEKLGDGYVAEPLDAKVVTTPDGQSKLVVDVPDKKSWVQNQLGIMGDELVDHESNREAALKLVDEVINKPIPVGFFDWSFSKQVEHFKSLGMTFDEANDLAIYLNAIDGDPAYGHDFRHFPVSIDAKPGDTFGSFLKRGFEDYYDKVAARVR